MAAFSWAQSPALSGIAHVAFRVADVAAARAFYQKLGFEQAFEFTREGKTTEAFIKINDRQFIELYPRDSQPTGLMHVCYESSSLEALYAEYVKRDLKPPAVRKAGAGNLLLVIRDPEENVIEYTQYMPGSMHFEDHGKHLGEHRISQHLLGATVAVRDLAAGRVFVNGVEAIFSATEWKLLVYLARNAGKVISPQALAVNVWGLNYVESSTIKMCIRRLRQKLGDDTQAPRLIRSYRGRGYSFELKR